MSKLIRTFVAIPLPQETKENLAKIQAKLKFLSPAKGINWVKPENFHITIFFFGDVLEEKLKEITQFLSEKSQRLKKCPFTVKGIGFFGSEYSPRVVWCGIDGNFQQINEISKEIKNFANTLGINTDDKPFSPHITIARIKESKAGKELSNHLKKLKEYDAGTFIADKIVLMQSTLSSSGPTYTPIANFDFQDF